MDFFEIFKLTNLPFSELGWSESFALQDNPQVSNLPARVMDEHRAQLDVLRDHGPLKLTPDQNTGAYALAD